jgi:hypothetical protein
MKKILFLLISVQLAGCAFFFAPQTFIQASASYTYPHDTVVTPSFFNLVPCPTCASAIAAPGMAGSAAPFVGASTAPNVAVTASAPVPSMAPCSSDTSVALDTARRGRHHKKHRGGISHFMQQILKFFMQLINKLLELLGGKQMSLHETAPAPSGVVTTGSVIDPNPCDNPSPSTAAEVPAQAATSPAVTSPSVSTAPAPSVAANDACTTPKQTLPMDPADSQKGVTIGNFYLTNDTWNVSNYQVAQTMFICDFNNWYVTATMDNTKNDGAVKSYPNVHQDFSSKPLISSFKTITSSFAETGPHVGIYEYAYDIWINGIAGGNGSTEVMIWHDNFGQTPAGTKQGTATFDGRTYDVWRSGTSIVSFVDTANTTTGTINLLGIFKYMISQGWIPATSNLQQIDYGPELISTNGQSATFKVTNFSLTAN